MALYKPTRSGIIIDVSDRKIDDTIFKQKAKLITMVESINPDDNVVTMRLDLLVTLYSSRDGDYGSEMSGFGLAPYPISLYADNLCALDIATKQVIYIYKDGFVIDLRTGTNTPIPLGMRFEDYIDLNCPEDIILQGDSFMEMSKQPSSPIEDMQRQFILLADQDPYNKFTQPITR